MQWFLLLLLTAFVSAGCSNHKKQAEDITSDPVANADTAEIDAPPAPEVPPPPMTLEEEVAKEAEPEAPPVTTPESAPTTTESPPPPLEASPATARYTVQSGDTLMKIAFHIYGDIEKWKDLFESNREKLKQANKLTAEMELVYQAPSAPFQLEKNGDPFLIKKGHTLALIAEEIYAKRSKWKKLYENNRQLIKDPNHIYAGFYIYYQITEQERLAAEKIRANKPPEASTQPQQPATTQTPAALDGLIEASRKPATKTN